MSVSDAELEDSRLIRKYGEPQGRLIFPDKSNLKGINIALLDYHGSVDDYFYLNLNRRHLVPYAGRWECY